MEKERSSKVIAIAALVVGVFALSIGFAAFTKDLTIQDINGVVNQDNTLNVHFVESSVTGTVLSGDTNFVSGDTATVSGTSVVGVKGTFQKKGDKIQYVFQVKNDATYDAFLNAITFSKTPTCVAKTGDDVNTPTVDVTSICDELMEMKVSISNTTTDADENDQNDVEGISTTVANIAGHTLSATAVETVTLTLEYIGNQDVDGDFEVDFGTVTLTYGSVD